MLYLLVIVTILTLFALAGRQRPRHRLGALALGVDERAVEVEQDGGEIGHEREWAQRFDLAGGGVTSEVTRCLRVVSS